MSPPTLEALVDTRNTCSKCCASYEFSEKTTSFTSTVRILRAIGDRHFFGAAFLRGNSGMRELFAVRAVHARKKWAIAGHGPVGGPSFREAACAAPAMPYHEADMAGVCQPDLNAVLSPWQA